MKNFCILLTIGLFISTSCPAAVVKKLGSDDNINRLHNEIIKLETDLQQKTEQLNNCAQKNKNFQIAGITTVGLTGVGIATNISLNSKLKSQKTQQENIQKKIQSAEIQADNFLQDLNKLTQNVDDKCAQDMFNTELNITEKNRLAELYNNLNEINENDISESDKILFEKMVRIVQKCQKE